MSRPVASATADVRFEDHETVVSEELGVGVERTEELPGGAAVYDDDRRELLSLRDVMRLIEDRRDREIVSRRVAHVVGIDEQIGVD